MSRDRLERNKSINIHRNEVSDYVNWDLDLMHSQAEVVAALPSKQHSLERTVSHNAYESAQMVRRRKSSRHAPHLSLPRDVETMSVDGLSTLETEDELRRKLQTIRQMTSSLEMKRQARAELQGAKARKLTGYKKWKYDRSIEWDKTKRKGREVLSNLEVWRSSFKEIEGNFGASIVSYFRFVKLLFFLNLFITLVQLLVIVMPQEVFRPKSFQETLSSNESVLTFYQKEALTCTMSYKNDMEGKLNKSQADISQGAIDFFQGTGWMEDRILFYGYFFNKTTHLETFQVDLHYNMPIAFFFAITCCLLVSLSLLVHRSAYGLKNSLASSGQHFNRAFNTVFCGWDYNLYKEKAANLKHKNQSQEYRSELAERSREQAKKNMTQCQMACLYFTRILINLFVLAVIGASFFLIYYITEESTKLAVQFPSGAMNLLVQYLPSLTITVLNIIVPFIFQKIVTAEKYSPDNEIKITIFRTVFLRLASLLFLLVSMRNVILNCDEGRECGICKGVGFKCWESYVGQQIYKLVLLNFVITVIITMLVEFPRKFVVSRLKDKLKLFDMIGEQEFDLSKNVLDIIYAQTLCWLGAFYSPLIPAMTLVKFFIFFYMKKKSLLVNCLPPARAYRSSQSNSFYMLVLLFSLVIVCVIPVGYCIGNIPPSQGCGPFRVYSGENFYMYTVIKDLVRSWPIPVPDIYFTIGSWAVFIPLIVVLILLIVYYAARISSSKKLADLLKEQLALEGKDKQFLLTRVNKALMPGSK